MSELIHYTPIGQQPNAAMIRALFADAQGWENQYRLIINLAKQLPAIPSQWQQTPYQISGCESQAWLYAEQGDDDRWHFACDSDARIIRGLIVIVLAAFNHHSREQILAFDIEQYFAELGLQKHLSPSRGNGLNAIVKAIIAKVSN